MSWLESMVAEDVNVECSVDEFAPEDLKQNDEAETELCELFN